MAEIKDRIGQHPVVKVISSVTGTLDELSDVNASNLVDGMILVYNGTTNKWEARVEDLTDINGGVF